MTLVRRVARPMLAALFVVEGYNTLRHPASKVDRVSPFVDRVSGPLNLPNDPELLIRANAVTMLAGGTLLASGRVPRVASTALAVALVPTTIAGHAFWEESDPAAKRLQRIQFLKNVSMLGGLMLAAVDTEGRPGLAYRAKLVRKDASRATKLTRREAKHVARAARREAKLVAVQAHDALT